MLPSQARAPLKQLKSAHALQPEPFDTLGNWDKMDAFNYRMWELSNRAF